VADVSAVLPGVRAGAIGGAEAAAAVAAIAVAALVQVSMLDQVRFVDGVPDLIAVAVVCAGLGRGPVAGALTGFLAGLAIDIVGIGLIGTSSLALTPIGYAVGAYGERLRRTAAVRPVLLVGLAAAGSFLARLLLSQLLGLQPAGRTTVLFAAVPTALLSMLLGLLALPLLRRAVRHGREAPEPLLPKVDEG
jgi:rod shape-determining protein MreD